MDRPYGKVRNTETTLIGNARINKNILSVTDNGQPALTRYQRVIVTVFPK